VKNKRVIAAMAVIGFALATWATAPSAQAKVNLPRSAVAKAGSGWTAHPVAPIVRAAPLPTTCGGVSVGSPDVSFDFNEPPGSTVAYDTLHPGDLQYALTQPTGHTGVVFNGGTVTFNGDQLLTSRFPNDMWSPGYGDFFICIVFEFLRNADGTITDTDGYNLWQFGRSSLTDPHIKGMPSYVSARGSGATLNPRLDIVGSGAVGWRTEALVRHDNTWSLYLDGVLGDTTTQAIGRLDLPPLSLGGKYWRPGANLTPVGPEDECKCKIAMFRAGVTAPRGPH
jgi:hypothetical protein